VIRDTTGRFANMIPLRNLGSPPGKKIADIFSGKSKFAFTSQKESGYG
jgi:hypothetical protein